MKDARLQEVIVKMQKHCSEKAINFHKINLNFEQFHEIVSESVPLLKTIFKNDLIIPEFSTFCESIGILYHKLKHNFDGKVKSNCLMISSFFTTFTFVACFLHTTTCKCA